MVIKQKDSLSITLKKQLQDYVYDIIGVIQDVHNEMPQGMPEFLYQEALGIALQDAGINSIKEYQHHPVYRGHTLQSYLKMDFVIPRDKGNVIVECKAIEKLSSTEYQQLFSYMLGTGFPIVTTQLFLSHTQNAVYSIRSKDIIDFSRFLDICYLWRRSN